MQTTQNDMEIRSTTPMEDGKPRRIQMPGRRTLIIAGAVTGGAIAAGLVLAYYLRKRAINS